MERSLKTPSSTTPVEAHEEESSAGRGDVLARALRRRAIQRKAERETAGSARIPTGAGQPLDPATRARMEPHFGASVVGRARLHTGGESARAASDLGAKAFTDGDSVHFGAGEHQPGTKEGDRLLAHELAHVADGAPTVSRKEDPAKPGDAGPAVSKPSDPAEKAADAKGDAVANALHPAPGAGGPPPPAPRRPGETGILTLASKAKAGDKEIAVEPGTAVEIVEDTGEKMKVKLLSGHDGVVAEVDSKSFQPQPGVATNPDTGKKRGDVYADFSGAQLWGDTGPKLEDVKQGGISDCFLLAAIGAVVSSNPSAIKNLFSPQESGARSYTVTLYKGSPDGKTMVPVQTTVDTKLPSLNKDAPEPGEAKFINPNGPPQLAYAGFANTERGAVLWPSLLEKAYAQNQKEGYGSIDKGGSPAAPMAALTGQMPADAGADGGSIAQIAQMKAKGQPVAVTSKGSKEHVQKNAFQSSGDSKYTGTLTTHSGDICQVMKGTLEITDNVSKDKKINLADSEGKIVGDAVESGTINYPIGAVDMKFKSERAPDKPENLVAAFDYRGRISKEYDVFAWHVYVVERVDGDKVILKNPWGERHPNPIPAAAFADLFLSVTTGTIPPPDAAPPGA